jgi:hypothetical protein
MDQNAIREKLAKLSPNTGKTVTTSQGVDPLKVWRTPMMEVSVGDLRALVKQSPKHPISQSFAQGVQGHDDRQRLVVHQLDLQALLEGKTCVIDENLENGKIIMTKRLGEAWKESDSPTDLPTADETRRPDINVEEPQKQE